MKNIRGHKNTLKEGGRRTIKGIKQNVNVVACSLIGVLDKKRQLDLLRCNAIYLTRNRLLTPIFNLNNQVNLYIRQNLITIT